MLEPKNPILVPDVREAKLPLWARERLRALRATVAELEQVVDTFQGEIQNTNVFLAANPRRADLKLPKNSVVTFRSNRGTIRVHHALDGTVQVQGDSRIQVFPQASTTLRVELIK